MSPNNLRCLSMSYENPTHTQEFFMNPQTSSTPSKNDEKKILFSLRGFKFSSNHSLAHIIHQSSGLSTSEDCQLNKSHLKYNPFKF